MYRVGISGSYGGLNLGDEAILQVIATELMKACLVELTVFSRKAEDTRQLHYVARVVPVRELSRGEILPEIAPLDLLSLGGGIPFDSEGGFFMREVLIAEEVGVPVIVYAIGAGPLEHPGTRALVRAGLHGARAITVRERRARTQCRQPHLLKHI